MTVNYDKANADLATLLAPRTTGWPQVAATGYDASNQDLNVLFAPASTGAAFGSTIGYAHSGTDLGPSFASLGSTTVVIATQPTAVSGANFSNSTQTITSNAASALGSKGGGTYTYTWTIASGSGITFTSQGSASTTLSASVASNASNTGTFFCAVSDGTTTTNTSTVAWTLTNFANVGFTFSPATPAGTSSPGTGVTTNVATPTIDIIPTGGSGGGNNSNYTYTWSSTVTSGNGTLTVNGVNGAAGSFSAFITSTSVAPTVTMSGTITCVVADVSFPANSISHTTSWTNHNASAVFTAQTFTYRGAFNSNSLAGGPFAGSTYTVHVPSGATHCTVYVSAPGGGGACPAAGFGGGGGSGVFIKTNPISVVASEIFAISSGYRGIGGSVPNGSGEADNTVAVENGTTIISGVPNISLSNTAVTGKLGGGTTPATPTVFQPTLVQGLNNAFGNLAGFSVSIPGAGAGSGTTAGAAGAAATLVGFTAAITTAGIAGVAGTGTAGGNGGGKTSTTGVGYTTAGSVFDTEADGQTNINPTGGLTTGGGGGGGSGAAAGPAGGNGWGGVGGESFIAFVFT